MKLNSFKKFFCRLGRFLAFWKKRPPVVEEVVVEAVEEIVVEEEVKELVSYLGEFDIRDYVDVHAYRVSSAGESSWIYK